MGTLLEKLKIKEGMPVLILNAPSGYFTRLSLDPKINPIYLDLSSPGKFSFVQFFAHSSSYLEVFPKLLNRLESDGFLWLCYQKKNKSGWNDLTRDKGWDIVEKTGYRRVSLIAIDDDWAAIRWKKNEKVKASKKMHYPEIDTLNRLIHLPEDMKLALMNANLTEKFNKMSFTHQKEYIEAIVSARKPETRKSRIEKTIVKIKNQNKYTK
jgi:hypothetical protein